MLKSLKDYQQQASELIETIKKRHKELQKIIIEKDLKSFATAHNLTVHNNCVKYEEFFELRLLNGINDNPSLQIKDVRKTTYLWIYDVMIDFDFPGYKIDHNEKSYDIKYVYDSDFPELKKDINNYIDSLNKSLKILELDLQNVNSEAGLRSLNYSYYCSNEDVIAKDINEIIKIAKFRKPFGD